MVTPLLPDHVLRLMSVEDRKLIGQTTAVESLATMEVRDEKQLQEQIASMLRRRDVPFIPPAMFRKSQLPPAWPDLTFAFRGHPIAWECKSIVGGPTKEQLAMHENMRRCGWQISIIRTLQEAVEILRKIDSDA